MSIWTLYWRNLIKGSITKRDSAWLMRFQKWFTNGAVSATPGCRCRRRTFSSYQSVLFKGWHSSLLHACLFITGHSPCTLDEQVAKKGIFPVCQCFYGVQGEWGPGVNMTAELTGTSATLPKFFDVFNSGSFRRPNYPQVHPISEHRNVSLFLEFKKVNRHNSDSPFLDC